ncbi:unnamed protein product [Calypogeia fissa]
MVFPSEEHIRIEGGGTAGEEGRREQESFKAWRGFERSSLLCEAGGVEEGAEFRFGPCICQCGEQCTRQQAGGGADPTGGARECVQGEEEETDEETERRRRAFDRIGAEEREVEEGIKTVRKREVRLIIWSGALEGGRGGVDSIESRGAS